MHCPIRGRINCCLCGAEDTWNRSHLTLISTRCALRSTSLPFRLHTKWTSFLNDNFPIYSACVPQIRYATHNQIECQVTRSSLHLEIYTYERLIHVGGFFSNAHILLLGCRQITNTRGERWCQVWVKIYRRTQRLVDFVRTHAKQEIRDIQMCNIGFLQMLSGHRYIMYNMVHLCSVQCSTERNQCWRNQSQWSGCDNVWSPCISTYVVVHYNK